GPPAVGTGVFASEDPGHEALGMKTMTACHHGPHGLCVQRFLEVPQTIEADRAGRTSPNCIILWHGVLLFGCRARHGEADRPDDHRSRRSRLDRPDAVRLDRPDAVRLDRPDAVRLDRSDAVRLDW